MPIKKNKLIHNVIVHINKDTSIWFLIILFIAYEMFSWNAHLYFLLLYIQALLYVTDNVKCTQQGNDFKFYIILILFLISGFILFFITVNENLLIMSKLAITCISSIWWTLFIKHFTQKLLIPKSEKRSKNVFKNKVNNELLISISTTVVTLIYAHLTIVFKSLFIITVNLKSFILKIGRI